MATFSITIDDSVASEVEKEMREGESKANTIERMIVTAVGRLAASRKWAKNNAKPKKAKAPKAAKKAAKKAVKKAAKKAAKKATGGRAAIKLGKSMAAEPTIPPEITTLL